jgi:osmotically-inducible protein OsmY
MTRRFSKGARVRALGATVILILGVQACGSLRRSPPVVDRSGDERILQEVRARLLAEPELDAAALRVEVDGGVVVLHGNVAGMGAWRCAIRNAELVAGVRTVVDHLTLERGPREGVCLAPATVSG